MNLEALVAPSACLSAAIGGIGLLCRLLPIAQAPAPARIPPTRDLLDAPMRPGYIAALRTILAGPVLCFHRRADPLWAAGCLGYHVAICLVVLGYAAAICSLVLHALAATVPFSPGPAAPSFAQLAALVFGNAEPAASTLLFGPFAPIFQGLALIELPLALIGNASLLAALLRGNHGSIRGALDPATAALRLPGRVSPSHLFVRSTITAIIATEFVVRLGTWPDVVHLHALLAFVLLAAFPFTHLAHIALAPLALAYALRRRRTGAVA